jgi:hypothetical protein
MSIQSKFPNLLPSLNLDFANVKNLDPRITFARASTATYYDGKTVAKAEENLLFQSQEFLTFWATSRASVVTNTTTAPDGTLTADSLIEDTTASNSHRVFNGSSSALIAGLTYTCSIFAKANTRSQLFIRKVGDGIDTNGCYFDLSAGTVTNAGSGVTGTIVALADGWYRCIAVCTNVLAANNSAYFGLAVGGSTIYTGDGTSGLYIWGAQLEQRSLVTAYTPTTTQPITNYIPVLLTAAAGVPRFDHNPITGESLGLLIEEQRTNLLTYSTYSNASGSTPPTNWGIGFNTGVTEFYDSFDFSGAKQVRQSGTSQRAFLQQSITVTAGTTYTLSAYFSSVVGGGDILAIGGLTAGFSGQGFLNGNAFTGPKRYSITFTPAANDSITLRVGLGTTTNATGVVIHELPQLEAGAFPTSYIPTVASQVTRSADVASMTGANFSSWYRAGEGTLYAEASLPAFSSTATIAQATQAAISDGTGNNVIRVRGFSFNGSSNWDAVIRANGTTYFDSAETVYGTVNFVVKNAVGYKVNDAANSVNAGAAVSGTPSIIPIVNQMTIGATVAGADIASQCIRRISFYPIRLTNAQLQAITG